MSLRKVTEEQIQEMRRLKGTMTPKEISRHLGINYITMMYHFSGNCRRKAGKIPGEKSPRCKKEKNREGFFNVDAVENWLA